MTDKEYAYDVFISYNKADLEFAEKLANRLGKECINARPIRVFFDQWDIEPGENVLLKIESAESSSRFIVLIMSPDWLKSNWTTLERVTPVYDDPAGLKGRIIPIMRTLCEPPPSIRILKWLDFTNDSKFERESKKLVARIQGRSLREFLVPQPAIATYPIQLETQSFSADIQEEELPSNIFTVTKLPSQINIAKSRVRRRNDVWALLGEGAVLPTFALDETNGIIYSFESFNNSQYRLGELCSEPTCEKIRTDTMFSSKSSRYLIEILNKSMTHYMEKLGMTYDFKSSKKTFFPLNNPSDESRSAKWVVGSKEYTRFLVRRISVNNPYYVHRSCKATFTMIGKWPFLKILPGWHFTYDGIYDSVPPMKMTSLSSRWMNRQRSHSVLDDVRFWVYLLTQKQSQINVSLGEGMVAEVACTPAFATLGRGIEGDYHRRLWQEKPKADFSEKLVESELSLNDVGDT